ncbi:hypothetical protein AT705_11975 [Pseudoalteromonas rubra]|uniref:Uncharacterized protein n=1 Tax=Pseudoalteromonas rubra TaxID=43658 RepID=A0A0U3HKU8_9GAMM|nr:hypothetical protein AT705_11975 [Pseudoalteromonas rubra]
MSALVLENNRDHALMYLAAHTAGDSHAILFNTEIALADGPSWCDCHRVTLLGLFPLSFAVPAFLPH